MDVMHIFLFDAKATYKFHTEFMLSTLLFTCRVYRDVTTCLVWLAALSAACHT